MNQIDTGKFIQELRREKNMTQRALADALSISDKTVSKWETGKGLPDVSLMLPLCEALGISVNELLCAKRLAPSEYQTKAEENIMDLMKEREENKKKVIIFSIVMFITLLGCLTIALMAAYIEMQVWQRILLISIAIIILLGGGISGTILDLSAGTFECRHCKTRFVPTVGQYIAGPHTLTLRKLTCPNCGKRSYCKRRLTH